MKKRKWTDYFAHYGKKSLFLVSVASFGLGCHKSSVSEKDLRDFQQVNLVANSSEYNPKTKDPSLINAFGIAWSPNGIAWVNSVGGHVSELYTAEGDIFAPAVNIPSPTDATGGLPCGIVFAGGKNFQLPNGAALFLFSGFDGVISGWNPAAGSNAIRLRNPPHASYTGLAIGASGGKNFIYGANFGQNRIDVWDTSFARVSMTFQDPNMPAGYSPYNIQAIGDWLFVMYGQLGADGHPIAGQGKGFVSVFNTDGSFVRRFASAGILNVPWGATMAPASFLKDEDLNDGHGNQAEKNDIGSSNRRGSGNDPVILIGNFGNGHINVFSLDGNFLGELQSHKNPIVIDGLWALSFAPSSSGVDPSRLYFTAGPEHESDGIFGYLFKQ